MVTSASDAAQYLKGDYSGPGVAIAMETMYEYTAYFASMDPREINATYIPSPGSPPVQIGFPLPEVYFSVLVSSYPIYLFFSCFRPSTAPTTATIPSSAHTTSGVRFCLH